MHGSDEYCTEGSGPLRSLRYSDPSYPISPTHFAPKPSSVPSSWALHLLAWPYGIVRTILPWKVLRIHTPLDTSQSTRRSCDMPLAVPKGVDERSGGDHTKWVLSPSSLYLSLILQSSSTTRLLSLSLCSPITSLCAHSDFPDPFIGSLFFVLQMHLPVLYKYWPLPTCMFPSLVIISLLLVIFAL